METTELSVNVIRYFNDAACTRFMLTLSHPPVQWVSSFFPGVRPGRGVDHPPHLHPMLTLNIPSLARQRCLPSWGPRRTPWLFFFVISQLFDAVDYSNYVFWVSETIIQ